MTFLDFLEKDRDHTPVRPIAIFWDFAQVHLLLLLSVPLKRFPS